MHLYDCVYPKEASLDEPAHGESYFPSPGRAISAPFKMVDTIIDSEYLLYSNGTAGWLNLTVGYLGKS